MLNTARRNIQYPNPNRADRPDIPAHFGYLAAALDVDVIYAQGTHAARLAAAHQASGGKFWWETDNLAMWYDDGAAWHSVGPQALVGTYAARPAATTVGPGSTYLATDTLGEWLSDGTTWTLITQGAPLITAATFAAAPFSTVPYDGQRVLLQVDATNGVNWEFRYNSGSASGNKWEFVGGPAVSSVVDGTNVIPTGAYADMPSSLSVTIPRTGDYIVQWGWRQLDNIDNRDTIYVSPKYGAAATADNDGIKLSSNIPITSGTNSGTESPVKALTTSDVVKLQGRFTIGGGIAPTLRGTFLRVIPVRIS